MRASTLSTLDRLASSCFIPAGRIDAAFRKSVVPSPATQTSASTCSTKRPTLNFQPWKRLRRKEMRKTASAIPATEIPNWTLSASRFLRITSDTLCSSPSAG